MRENKEITTIFDPRRTGTTGSGPSSSGGTRRPLPTPPSVVIVTAPPLDNPAPPVEPSSGEIIMPNGPSLAAPPPGSHCPQVLAPPSQSAIHPPQAVGAPVVQGTCNAQPVTDQSPPQPCPGNSRRASALQSLRNFRKSCCSRSARKMYCGVCVTVCVTASWVCATHSIKYLYHLGPTADSLKTSDAQVVEVVGGPASSPYASPSTSSSSSGIVSLGPSSSPGASSTRLIPATEVSPTYDAPFFTTWFCTNWTILFFPIYAIGRFLASPCSSRRGAANAGGEEGEEGAAQDSERATVTKKSRCCRCCCCGCKSCCRRRRSEEGSGGPRGSPTATSVSSSSSSSSSEDEGNGGSQSSSSVQSSPERDEGRRERKRRRRRRRRRRRGRERDLEEGEEAEVSQSSPGMSSPSRSAVSSPHPPPTPTKQCCFCMCRKKKTHHHHHHHHHHKRHHCCDLLGDTMQRFRDKGFTPARFLTRCSLFCLLWVGYNYMYVHSLRILFSTDAMALFATHACCVYLLSWVLLHHQFVGVRIVAVITCDTGIALLAYMDGITGSPTLGGVVLAAFAAAGSAVYKVLFKKVMGEASMGQVALFFSIVGLLNALLLWPLLLALYLLGAETFLWNDLPWLELLLAGGLSLLANLFSNFSVAVTYDLFITLGFITAVPVSAALDVVLYGAHFAGMKLAGIVLISVGFFLVMFPDNWPDYITRLLRNIILLSHSARWSRRQRHGGAVGQRRDVVDYRTGYIRSHLRSPSGRVR